MITNDFSEFTEEKARVGLSIEKIGNPSVEKREPLKTSAIDMNGCTFASKDPHDKNSGLKLTEKQRMVLYPQMKSRYAKLIERE